MATTKHGATRGSGVMMVATTKGVMAKHLSWSASRLVSASGIEALKKVFSAYGFDSRRSAAPVAKEKDLVLVMGIVMHSKIHR